MRLSQSVKLPTSFQINTQMLAGIALILYMTNALVRTGFQWVLWSDEAGNVAGIALPYVFVALLCLIEPRRYIRMDFIALLIAILLFLYVTLLVHPEYLPYYQRETFGVWDHVLVPYRGIYAYLFVRLFDDPKKLLKAMKLSGYLTMVYSAWRIHEALARGYWMGVGVDSAGMIKMQYSVTFGYDVLPFALLFLYCALTDKKIIDFIMTGVLTVMILIGGSRGPVLFIGVFLLLYMILIVKKSRKKALIIGATALVVILFALFYRNLLELLISILDSFGFSSRFFTTLLDGTVADDNNRAEIWAAAIRMIQKNPFGYGAMGARHQITQYIYAGYPHNIILEMMIDFGVIPAVLILGGLGISFIKILYQEKYSDWRPLAFPFFSTTGALMGSMTYWSVPFFWVSVAVIVSCFQYSRRPVTRLNKMIRDMLEIRAKRKKKPKQNAESVSQDL